MACRVNKCRTCVLVFSHMHSELQISLRRLTAMPRYVATASAYSSDAPSAIVSLMGFGDEIAESCESHQLTFSKEITMPFDAVALNPESEGLFGQFRVGGTDRRSAGGNPLLFVCRGNVYSLPALLHHQCHQLGSHTASVSFFTDMIERNGRAADQASCAPSVHCALRNCAFACLDFKMCTTGGMIHHWVQPMSSGLSSPRARMCALVAS